MRSCCARQFFFFRCNQRLRIRLLIRPSLTATRRTLRRNLFPFMYWNAIIHDVPLLFSGNSSRWTCSSNNNNLARLHLLSFCSKTGGDNPFANKLLQFTLHSSATYVQVHFSSSLKIWLTNQESVSSFPLWCKSETTLFVVATERRSFICSLLLLLWKKWNREINHSIKPHYCHSLFSLTDPFYPIIDLKTPFPFKFTIWRSFQFQLIFSKSSIKKESQATIFRSEISRVISLELRIFFSHQRNFLGKIDSH